MKSSQNVQRYRLLCALDSAHIQIIALPIGKRADRMIFVLNAIVLAQPLDGFFDDGMRPCRSGFPVNARIVGKISEGIGKTVYIFEAFLDPR